MQELLRSNDWVLLSWAEATLNAAGFDCVILDYHASVVDGCIGAVPRRLMLLAADPRDGRALLEAAAPSDVRIAGFSPASAA